MAQQIIIDNYGRQIRAQAAAAPYLAAADAITGVTRSIEQVLYDQMARKEQEKTRRLSVMGTMVNRYGFDALGPDFASQWERDSGITFPRDDTGKPVVPSTYEERINKTLGPVVEKKLREDPNTALQMSGLMEKAPNPENVRLQERELDLKERAMNLEYSINALRAKAELARAGGAAKEYQMPSGFVYNPKAPQGQQFEYVGFEKPSMPMYQFNAAKGLVDSNLKVMEGEKTGLEIEGLAFKLQQAKDGIDKDTLDLLKSYDKLPEDKRFIADALLKSWAEEHGVQPPAEKKAFGGWVRMLSAAAGAAAGAKVGGVKGAVIGGVGGFVAPSIVEGITPPPAMGTPPPSGGPQGRSSRGVSPTTQMRATGATAESQARLGSLTDDQLRQALMQERATGKADIDILQEAGNDFRVMKILSELAAGGR